MLGIVLFILTVNSANFWFEVQQTVTKQNVTTFEANGTAVVSLRTTVVKTCTSQRSVVFARDMIAASFRAVLPFIFMVLGNIFLIRALIKSKRRSRGKKQSKTALSSMKKEVQFTISIFAMNLMFMIVYLPLTITVYTSGFLAFFPNLASASFKATNALVFNISVYIAFLNNTLPLLINLKFNKIFRKELINMLFEVRYSSPLSRTSTVSSTWSAFSHFPVAW